MNVSLHYILENPLFEHAQLLAGADGCFRTVERVSVFDSPFGMDVIEQGIIAPGDFFVTGLLQFSADSDALFEVFRVLIAGQCSGVCLIAQQPVLINDRIHALCDQNHFPIVYLSDDIAYAQIMDTINRYIAIENLNLINQLRLDKICNDQTTASERIHLLESMNRQIGSQIMAVCFLGRLQSQLAGFEWNTLWLSRAGDIYIDEHQSRIILLSADDAHALRVHLDVTRNTIAQYFEQTTLGISRSYPRHWVAKAVQEARIALDMACAEGVSEQSYDPLSITQLLFPLRNSREAQDFCAAFTHVLRAGTSPEGCRELWNTLQVFVHCTGDFKKSAQMLRQHENTVRYRINRVKTLLNMEHDPIRFYEAVGAAVHLHQILRRDPEFEDLLK